MWSWYCPPFKSEIQLSKAEVESARRVASADFKKNRRKSEFNMVSCLELSVTLPITYSLCVQQCNFDKCVTSTCFRIRVNNNLVNTTEQPKGNMPDHVYHGNIKCFCICLICIVFLQAHALFLCLTICLFTIWSAVIIYKRSQKQKILAIWDI